MLLRRGILWLTITKSSYCAEISQISFDLYGFVARRASTSAAISKAKANASRNILFDPEYQSFRARYIEVGDVARAIITENPRRHLPITHVRFAPWRQIADHSVLAAPRPFAARRCEPGSVVQPVKMPLSHKLVASYRLSSSSAQVNSCSQATLRIRDVCRQRIYWKA